MELVRTLSISDRGKPFFSRTGTIAKKLALAPLLSRYARPFLILNTLFVCVTGLFMLVQWGILPFAETLFVLYSVSGIVLAITHSGVGKQRSWKFRLVWLGAVAGLLLILAGIGLSGLGAFYFPYLFTRGRNISIATFFVLPGLFTTSLIWVGLLSLFTLHVRGVIMSFQEMMFPRYSALSLPIVRGKKSRFFGYRPLSQWVRLLLRYALPYMMLNTLIVLVTGFFTLIKWRILPFVETLFALYGVSGIVLAITHSGVGKQRSWKFRLVWLGTVAGLLFIFVVIMLSWVGVVYLPNIFDAGIYSYIGTFFVLPGLLTVSGIWKICRRRARKSQKVHRKPHQRSGEVLVNLCCSLAMLSLGSYSAFIEPNMLRVERIDIVSDKVSEEVTILHLTDMHITQIGTHEQKIFQRIRELQPDMIVRTGDFLDVFDTEEKRQILQELAAIFRQFAPKYGHYAVLGNHDEWHMDAKAFAWFDELSGTKTLINDKHAFPTPAGQFLVTGLWPSTSRVVTKADFDEWWQEVAKDDFTILLWHYPDYILQAAHLSIDLCLAGHLHGGGQVRLPFIGAIPVVYEALVHHVDSDFPRKWTAGYHEVGNTRIHVGIGTGGTHVRFNCPPTITLFTLRPEV